MSTGPVTIRARALAAADALPPTFPIGTFVAANPLRGLEHLDFEQAAEVAAVTSGARSYLAELDYRELYDQGRIGRADLERAIARHGFGGDLDDAVRTLLEATPAPEPQPVERTRVAERDAAMAVRLDAEVARWCAAHLDHGQADWVLPGRDQGLWRAWRRLAPVDPGLRRLVGRAAARRVAELPDLAADALAVLVDRLVIDPGRQVDYFRASLRRLPGWGAAVARDEQHDDLIGLLALQLALEHVVLGELPADTTPWAGPDLEHLTPSESVRRRAVWQEALELGYRDRLLSAVARPVPSTSAATRPAESQVVLCIDVRSEGLRRHLEQVGPHDTVGFAGFFGLPVRVADLDHEPVPSCPVIVEPRATMREVPMEEPARVRRREDRRRATDAAWAARHDAKSGPAAPFAFAEAAGWVLGPLAALNTFVPGAAGQLRIATARRAVPPVATRMDVGPVDAADAVDAAHPGFAHDEQVRVAHGALTTMGLTSGFAPLVLFCGHRSSTTNNPFAAALDCGACAGKAGGPNARSLAELLNRPAVRDGLRSVGIDVPDTTWFVAGEHETTTDSVHVLDRHLVPTSHRERLERLERDLAEAGRRLAAERSAMLPVAGHERTGADSVRRRSADWAEPLPEWGLVRNAAVVVGPRALTAGRDLERRVFLHSYDPVADTEAEALGAILTGPLVVGHWISSQYYFSTTDPVRHGAGTKPLHNVVGGIGVFEGPGGDLRVGLPLESVQFAGGRVHEPLRLLAVVNAPLERMEALLERNVAVTQLLDNGWVRLVVGDEQAGWFERLRGGSWERWSPASAGSDGAPAHDATAGAHAGATMTGWQEMPA